MAEKRLDLESEYDLESLFDTGEPSNRSDGDGFVVKQSLQDAPEVRVVGRSVMRGTTKCGMLRYFLHWTPPAVQAICDIHPDCYATWPLITSPTEDTMVQWISDGPAFNDASDHMRFLPAGWYYHRLVR